MTGNMYFDYRSRASNDNMVLKSRERAAELLGISESSLSNYETGKTKTVPPEMVAQMASVYRAPEMKNIYCKTVCPIGCGKNIATHEASIEAVAVHLINSTEPGRLATGLSKFLAIAEDGSVDETEKECLKAIAAVFNPIVFAISEFGILAERQGITWN